MLRIHRLRTVADPAFAPAMALYAASFPKHEQRLEPSQRRIMAHEQYHFGILRDEEGFAGLALFWTRARTSTSNTSASPPRGADRALARKRSTCSQGRASPSSSRSIRRWTPSPAVAKHSTSAPALPPIPTRTSTHPTARKTAATPSWSCPAPARLQRTNTPPSPRILPML